MKHEFSVFLFALSSSLSLSIALFFAIELNINEQFIYKHIDSCALLLIIMLKMIFSFFRCCCLFAILIFVETRILKRRYCTKFSLSRMLRF